MEAILPNTTAEAWKLNEAGLSIVPLGSPFETPPEWFVEGRCSGDIEKARVEWPKAPRLRWKQYQETAPEDDVIEQWTTLYPHANWAIVTGYGVVVVDADSAEAVQFIENGGITRTPLKAVTSKGKHYYFQVNPEYPVHNSVRKNKIDLRGIGGYVVAPGSTHADGTLYRWETDGYMNIGDTHDLLMLTPDDIAAINGFNGQSLEDKPAGNLGFSTDQYPLPHDGSNLAEGQGRNNAAASMAGQLIRQNYSLMDIKKILDQWNQSNTPPLSSSELNTTIASIVRTHGNNHPGSGIMIEPQSPARQFAFSHVKELVRGVRPINWLIKGFLETDSLSLMFGEPACGKSFSAIDLACCVATGKEWHGKAVKRPGSVFYIAGEGFNGLSRRLMAWQVSHGYNLRNAPLYVSQCSASLTDLGNARMVSESIQQIVEETGGVIPSLIVIDTLARNFGAADENATKEMNTFINHIDQLLRSKYECCVLIVHHTGVGSKDRARGNSALKGALDAEYAVVKSGDEVKISAKKMKDADEPEPMHFFFESVRLPFADEDGEQQYSCVLKHLDPDAVEQMKTSKELGTAQKRVLDILHGLITKARSNLERGGRDPNLARIEAKDLRNECVKIEAVVGRNNWSRTFTTLVEKELIIQDGLFVSLSDQYDNLKNEVIN
ncbi:AAA family ATPase [Endozoicomonas ascidiicola]|uniref:AAA family ATPase n=1 Tax=Endozoicomonas ascidiicola TaxID=1698521 RepID=UPI000A7C5B0C|nr:AAA family ATPase [Endozoicomonas ascidiicola]